MTDEHLVQKTNASVRHGKIIVITSLASILVWILLSEGYDPNFDFFTNIYYSMKIEFFEICPRQTGTYPPPCSPLFSFMTKNLILLSVMVGTYGFLAWKSLIPSPVFLLSSIISKMKVSDHRETIITLCVITTFILISLIILFSLVASTPG